MTSIDYRYDECGLDNVILSGLTVVKDDDGDDVITIPHIGALHRLLVSMVASKPSGLEPKEVRFLRTELGMTQAELAELVGRDAQTVGRWERGENPVDRAAEVVIRAHAIQTAGNGEIPQIQDLAVKTTPTVNQAPFRIDASNPDDYRPMAA